MGYLHAKGILHKDMKSKNVFYDNGKIVITDFGLFTISGVLQAGRYLHSIIQHLPQQVPQSLDTKQPNTEWKETVSEQAVVLFYDNMESEE